MTYLAIANTRWVIFAKHLWVISGWAEAWVTTSQAIGEFSVISTGEKPRADHSPVAVRVSGAE